MGNPSDHPLDEIVHKAIEPELTIAQKHYKAQAEMARKPVKASGIGLCGDCIFFQRHQQSNREGTCRFNPPTHQGFPTIRSHDGCRAQVPIGSVPSR